MEMNVLYEGDSRQCFVHGNHIKNGFYRTKRVAKDPCGMLN